MTEKSRLKQILWAVDPFEFEAKPDSWAIMELERWAVAAKAPIQPVHILSVPRSDFGPGGQGSWVKHNVPLAEKSLRQYVGDLHLAHTLPPKVLLDHSGSIKDAVARLIDFARLTRSQMIVVSSRGKSGLGRLLFGSFAETLVAQSNVPILFLNHLKSPDKKHLNRVLFSTDFSDSSKEAFESFLLLAEAQKAEIVLYHGIVYPVPATGMMPMGGVAVFLPDTYLEEQRKWAGEEGQKWVSRAADQGISARFIVDDSQDIPTAILNIARLEEAGLIATASQSGPVEATIVGSVARAVLRSNQYPVWVYGPKALGGPT